METGRSTHCLRVTDLPELMADPAFLTLIRPLSQFIADWNTWPEVREKMLDGKPDCELFYLSRIAAIVHALCLRDEVPIQGWVFDARLPEPEMMEATIPVESNYGKLIIAKSPEICQYHNVYFEAEMLDKATDRQRFNPFLEDGRHWLEVERA